MKNVRSSQRCTSMNFCAEFSKAPPLQNDNLCHENVSPEAQVKDFFILWESYVPF